MFVAFEAKGLLMALVVVVVVVILVAGRIDPTLDPVVEVVIGFFAVTLVDDVIAVLGFNAVFVAAVVVVGRVVFGTEDAAVVDVVDAGLVDVDFNAVVVVAVRVVKAVRIGLADKAVAVDDLVVDAVGRFVAVVERFVVVVNLDDDIVLVNGFLSPILAIVVGLLLAVVVDDDLAVAVVKRFVVLGAKLVLVPELLNFVVTPVFFVFDNVVFVAVVVDGFVAGNFVDEAVLIVAFDGTVLLTATAEAAATAAAAAVIAGCISDRTFSEISSSFLSTVVVVGSTKGICISLADCGGNDTRLSSKFVSSNFGTDLST